MFLGHERFGSQVLNVAHLFLLGLQVAGEAVLGLDFGGDAFDDAYAGSLVPTAINTPTGRLAATRAT